MAEFFAMGGYAFYVWASYGAAALLILLEILWLRKRQRTILQRLGRMKRMTEVDSGVKVEYETKT